MRLLLTPRPKTGTNVEVLFFIIIILYNKKIKLTFEVLFFYCREVARGTIIL
jgi:hypothetical protein